MCLQRSASERREFDWEKQMSIESIDDIIAECEAAAKAITPGNDWWRRDQLHATGMSGVDKEFIASMTPARVLALCDAARQGSRAKQGDEQMRNDALCYRALFAMPNAAGGGIHFIVNGKFGMAGTKDRDEVESVIRAWIKARENMV